MAESNIETMKELAKKIQGYKALLNTMKWTDETEEEIKTLCNYARQAEREYNKYVNITECYIGNDCTVNIQYEAIFKDLLAEVAKCERYATDFLIDFEIIILYIHEVYPVTGKGKRWLLGFRDYGVDHESFINCRGIDSDEYRTVYSITLSDIIKEGTSKKCLITVCKLRG